MEPRSYTKLSEHQLDEDHMTLANQISKKQNKYLFDLYTPQKIASKLEKVFLLELENAFQQFPNQRMGLVDFITCFLSIVKHKKEQQIFLVSGLIDLFIEITEYNNTKELFWDHFTNFLIENVIEADINNNLVKSKYISISMQKDLLPRFLEEVISAQEELLLRRNKMIAIIITKALEINYSPELRRVIVLDNITENLILYDEHSQVQKKLYTNKENHILDTAILYFGYSRSEKRIGACLQDYTLAFWDISDNFKFEKTFSTNLDVLNVFIKYIEFSGTWITYDQKNVIFVWDIERESSIKLPHRNQEKIMDICEIPHLKLLAACSLDKKLVFYDIIAESCVQQIQFETVSAHSLVYAHDFMVLLSAAYEDFALIWIFDGIDCSIGGKLKGHNAQITAINVLIDTPLAITADEIGFIKTWDLRYFNCVQTIHFESRQPIHQFLNINSKLFCGAEIRLHWFEFEDEIKVNANGIEIKNNPPLCIKYNQMFEQLVVATKSDVRLIDVHSGKTLSILANVIQPEEEITGIKLYLNHKKMLLCDNKGNLKNLYLPNGSLYANHIGHHQEITQIYVDYANKFVLTAAWDSSIWDYETFKMIGACSNDFEDIHKIQFLYPYNCLISLDTSSQVIFWTWANTNAFKFLTPAVKINLISPRGRALNCNQMFALRLKLFDMEFSTKEELSQPLPAKLLKGMENNQKQYCLYLADERGQVYAVDINHILEDEKLIFPAKNAMKRTNYYPLRTHYSSSNGIFYTIEELKQQVEENIDFQKSLLIDFPSLDMIKWHVSQDMWSIFGELLCVSNIEHPLPYRWRIILDNDSKRKIKLLNSLRILQEIGKRYPNFQVQEFTKNIEDNNPKREPQVVTFAKLLHQIEVEDKEQNKKNTISLKQMELRKSKRIYASGTTDDFINSKKNKNLNNQKLFEKVSNHGASSQARHQDSQPQQEKQNFGPNFSIIEKIEIMLQKDPKETQNKQVLIKRFDEDYKKFQKHGEHFLERIQPHYVPTIKYQEIPSVQFDTVSKNLGNSTLQLTEISQYKNPMLNTSKSSNSQNFTFNLNNTRSSTSLFPRENKGEKEIEWLKYAIVREETLPNILKNNVGMKNYISNVPYTKDDSFQIPNLVKRGQRKQSQGQFKQAIKFQAVTSDNNNEKLGIPVFQRKMQSKEKKMKKQKSVRVLGDISLHSPASQTQNRNHLQSHMILPSVSTRVTKLTVPTSPAERNHL
ncbi:rna recognition motif [Stylonychia lemnae]|uniref:Rna recognition motif n=1 Tax=Stylonychia lemnae TaxID=5949 RepID=A0A078AF95_STYLE|nr:rna recognition motif [Stylonychia lemnae]|eukprot:CDW80516.1 rna recognition motif [Stylonychia lemnae]